MSANVGVRETLRGVVGPPGAAPGDELSPPARTPRSAATDRAELLHLLQRDGILYRSATQPVLSGDGTPARWMLDSLSVTLTPRGAELAARCLLELLEQFEGRQLATYGLTGVPLLQGCVLHGRGRYRGALVRKERKRHGSLRLIEGRLDPSEPVVVVDDSVSSGHAMRECIRQLEAAGFHAEGGVCLVRFDFDRGPAQLLQAGYRVAAVFDIWEDFILHMPGEAPYLLNPTKQFGNLVAAPGRAPEGLHPAHLARRVMAEYLRTGRVLGAPSELDRSYDSAGGCWVSLRRRRDIYDRPARNGHWHFPGEPRGTCADDVVLASVKTAAELAHSHADGGRTLEECAVAVTFFSELEECTVGELDNDRFGIVVRSRERSPRMGGALPRMPGIANDWQQLVHAWRNNARLLPLERYTIYRHGVEKVVEPGAAWQPTGVPADPCQPGDRSPRAGAALAARARRHVLDQLGRAGDVPGDEGPLTPPDDVEVAFVTVYANGRVVGCVGGPLVDDGRLGVYARAALRDDRFEGPRPDDDLAVSVAVLTDRLEIGQASPDWVVRPVRFADQALAVEQGPRRGLLLPSVAVTRNLTPHGYVDEVIDKAGITRPPYSWTRYDCETWLADGSGVHLVEHGLPKGEPAGSPEAELSRLLPLLTGYVRRNHAPTGPGYRRYDPFADRLAIRLDAPRLSYGAWVKARAGLREQALDDVRRLQESRAFDGWAHLDGSPPSIAELAFLLLALLELGEGPAIQESLAARLWAQIDGHGRFATHRDAAAASPEHQDYSPGQALLALAVAAEAGVTSVPEDVLRNALRFYRMRFRQNHDWGAVVWLLQAFGAWGRVTDDPSCTAFAYEIADWALQSQSRRNGAFLNDHQVDTPGATTALYLEGLAAMSATAGAEGSERAPRYRSACEQALLFLDRIVYQPRDAPVLPNPAWALGGVRSSVTAGAVYLDYVHHALAAMLELQALWGQA